MPAIETKEGEVNLNGVRYRIKGPVQAELSSAYPEKTVTGDYTRDSQQRASVHAMSEWRGGIGANKYRPSAKVDRAWWSTCQLRYPGHLVLPGLVTATAVVTGTLPVGAIGELANEIYAAFGVGLRKYNNTTDSWGAALATLPAEATDALNFRLGGTVYLAFATKGTGGGYTYSSDGAAWTDDTKDTQFLAFHDDRLWGIDATGQLWFSTAIGVETNEAQLPLPNDSVTSLFEGRVPNGDLVLYVGTTEGLWVHDIDNARFMKTDLALPRHPDNGKGATRWRDSVYYPVGNGVYRYVVGREAVAVTVMGPDRDDGLPSDKRGSIRQLLSTPNDLLAIIDASTSPAALDTLDSTGVLSAANTPTTEAFQSDTGYSQVLGWDQEGWEVKWLGGNVGQAISYAHVSNAYSTYRLWFATNQRVYYMALPRDVVNPNEVSNFSYATSGVHETPWFDADQKEVLKLALDLRVELAGATATETAIISYGLNYATSYTQFGTISANGIMTYLFPNSTAPTGTDFRAIRFRVELARGSTTTVTPDVLSLTLTYRKKVAAKNGFTFEIDHSGEWGGRSPQEQHAALVTALASTTKVEFTFRDDAGLTRNYWVDVEKPRAFLMTGHVERGSTLIRVVEP